MKALLTFLLKYTVIGRWIFVFIIQRPTEKQQQPCQSASTGVFIRPRNQQNYAVSGQHLYAKY